MKVVKKWAELTLQISTLLVQLFFLHCVNSEVSRTQSQTWKVWTWGRRTNRHYLHMYLWKRVAWSVCREGPQRASQSGGCNKWFVQEVPEWTGSRTARGWPDRPRWSWTSASSGRSRRGPSCCHMHWLWKPQSRKWGRAPRRTSGRQTRRSCSGLKGSQLSPGWCFQMPSYLTKVRKEWKSWIKIKINTRVSKGAREQRTWAIHPIKIIYCSTYNKRYAPAAVYAPESRGCCESSCVSLNASEKVGCSFQIPPLFFDIICVSLKAVVVCRSCTVHRSVS